jgi:hypothetical protein
MMKKTILVSVLYLFFVCAFATAAVWAEERFFHVSYVYQINDNMQFKFGRGLTKSSVFDMSRFEKEMRTGNTSISFIQVLGFHELSQKEYDVNFESMQSQRDLGIKPLKEEFRMSK